MNNSTLLIAEYCKLQRATLSLEENSINYTFIKEVTRPYGIFFDVLYQVSISEDRVHLRIRPNLPGRSDIQPPEYFTVNLTLLREGINYNKFLAYIEINREAVNKYCEMIVDKEDI